MQYFQSASLISNIKQFINFIKTILQTKVKSKRFNRMNDFETVCLLTSIKTIFRKFPQIVFHHKLHHLLKEFLVSP